MAPLPSARGHNPSQVRVLTFLVSAWTDPCNRICSDFLAYCMFAFSCFRVPEGLSGTVHIMRSVIQSVLDLLRRSLELGLCSFLGGSPVSRLSPSTSGSRLKPTMWSRIMAGTGATSSSNVVPSCSTVFSSLRRTLCTPSVSTYSWPFRRVLALTHTQDMRGTTDYR